MKQNISSTLRVAITLLKKTGDPGNHEEYSVQISYNNNYMKLPSNGVMSLIDLITQNTSGKPGSEVLGFAVRSAKDQIKLTVNT